MNNIFIPSGDSQFATWAQTLLNVVAAQPVKYGLTAEVITELTSGVETWETSFQSAIQQRDAARAAVVAKDTERKALVEFIRSVARQIQADPNVSDSSKMQAGLPVHSSSRTPAPIPTTSPVVTIEPTQVQEHTIRLMDDENPHRRSRPRGVMSCEVIGFVGNSHPGAGDFKPFGLTTRMHKIVSFPATDVGKTAWYRFRWINTRGIEGPWSTTYTATITG